MNDSGYEYRLQDFASNDLDDAHKTDNALSLPYGSRGGLDQGANDVDPLLQRIYDVAVQQLEALGHGAQITIREIADLLNLGESAVRQRLNILVEHKLLDSLPGKGRRPTQYYLPDQEDNQEEYWVEPPTDEELLRALEQKEAALSEALQQVQEDIAALRRVSEIRRMHITWK